MPPSRRDWKGMNQERSSNLSPSAATGYPGPAFHSPFSNPPRIALLASAQRTITETAERLKALEERMRSLGLTPVAA